MLSKPFYDMKPTSFFKPFLIGAAFMLATPVFSQTHKAGGHFTFAWGEEYELPRRHQDLGFIGNAKDGYIQISHQRRNSIMFQKFDAKLHLTGTTETDISNLPRKYAFEQIAMLGDKYYWFFSIVDKKGESREVMFAQEIDLQTGALKGRARQISSTSDLVQGPGKYHFYYSFDHSKVMIRYMKKPERRNNRINNEVVGFNVFDENLQKLWGRQIRMPYTEQKMDTRDFSIDDEGNIYVLAKVYEEERSRKEPDYHFEILKWSKEKNDATAVPFRFTDKFVNSAFITEDAQHNIIVGGYYTNRKFGSSVDGLFLLKLDESKNELNNMMKGFYPFPAGVMQEYESARMRRKIERQEEKGVAENPNLELRNIVMKSDGSVQVFGEEFHIVVNTVSNGRSSSTYTTYFYDDIIAMEIDKDGEMKWVKKIPKSQRGSGGFKNFTYGDDTYFFFMDNKKNLDIQKDETPATHVGGAGGILMAVRINAKGKTSKSMVFDVREEKMNMDVTNFKRVDDNQMMVRGYARRKASQAALITFE